jgi:hypothetical protein
MKTFKQFKEMAGGVGGGAGGAPANNVGSGNIAGAGVGLSGEPGVHPRKKRKHNPIMMDMSRRKV